MNLVKWNEAVEASKRIRLSQYPRPSDEALEEKIAAAKGDLWRIALNKAQGQSFEEMYCAQFCLVLWEKGQLVYDYAVELLRRMSLCMRSKAYYTTAKRIGDLTAYMDHTFVLAHDLLDVAACALVAYDRPVARRWRRAISVVRWVARLRKWRAAFLEAWLRPGGAGECAMSKRFAKNAAWLGAPHFEDVLICDPIGSRCLYY